MSRVTGHLRGKRTPVLLVAVGLLVAGIGITLLYAPRGSSSEREANGAKAAASVATPASGNDARRSLAAPSSSAKQFPNYAAKEGDAIRLLAGAFDPLTDPLPAQSGIPIRSEVSLARDQSQHWLVQVRDQRFREAIQAVRTAGGAIAGVIPDDTYMVRATPMQRAEISRAPAVRWMGYYQPAWRVPVAAAGKKGLLELVGTRTYRVTLFPGDPSAKATVRALSSLPGLEVVEDAGSVVDVRATAAQIPAIAALPAVQWIGVKPRVVPHNINARWVNDTGVRDVYAATAPGRLTGLGQTAGVADTGLNYTYDLNGRAHVGFRDCNPDGTACKTAIYTQTTPGNAAASINAVDNNATAHRKMVAYFDIGSTGPNMYDESSHGSHTAGSVDGDQPPYDTFTGSDGLAPAANHVHQNIATASGGLITPSDDYDLWRQAYRPRKPASVSETSPVGGNLIDFNASCVDPAGATAISNCYRPLEDARTHNNSYGLIAPIIDDTSAARLDQFVWDHEDMTIVVSAGNAGPDLASIGSPSVAKNELSSGASANGRQPMVSIDSMASFSSHGPTGDGRFGVDLATPGQIVVSSKGGTTDGYHVAQGTSMSGPILTGLATLVRQYFFDGYARAGGDGFAAGSLSPARRHNPSAALVKAALSNGAARMRGFYTGDDGNVRALDGQWPSAGQGFGRVSLDNSLYFTNDPTNNWYTDVYRGDAAAFPVGVGASRTFTVHAEPGQPLDVTLAWTDSPAAPPAGTPALINNLDLTVTGPGGTYVGNNMNSRATPVVAVAETTPGLAAPDIRNLTERVRIASPAAGDYTITVNAPVILLGNQGFALAASGNISPVGGPLFAPGPALQRDVVGNPTISNIRVDTISANTAKIFFDTNEPTTANAEVLIGATPTTFVDSYNVGTATGFPGLDEAPTSIETSAEYGDKPVVGTKHEILVTGLAPGQVVAATLRATDLASTPNQVTQTTNFASPSSVYQADADDTGQLYEDPATAAQAASWRTGTQLYASDAGDGTGVLGAFAFRIPQAAVNPANIIGAAVELTSTHDWINRYTEDAIYDVDLLNPSVEPGWGTQNYSAIKSASADARVYPETTHKRGDYQKYAFTFRCADLQALKNTLTAVDTNGDRMAAFRWETQPAAVGLFAMDFGFNRRSRGPTERPKLILFTGQNTYPDGRPCSPSTPAPTISSVGTHEGHPAGAATVSWETNVPSNSLVLFRQQGTTPWIQVGTPALTKIHHVEVFGINPSLNYEFAVRSVACNGATTTDTNGGQGYAFLKPQVLGTPIPVAGPYDFEGSDQGWTTMTIDNQDPDQPLDTEWRRGGPGASSSSEAFNTANLIASVAVKQYHDQNEALLTAPGPVSFSGTLAAVEFYENHNLEEPPPDPLSTNDALHVQYSTNGGTSWNSAEIYQGTSPGYPSFVFRRATFPAPSGSVLIRFSLVSDDNTSFPPFEGASVDQVSFVSYSPSGGRPSIPLTGPVPPPSAGATGLNPPATRTGPATAGDIAAGTGFCNIPVANRRPDARDDSATVPQGGSVLINVLANDVDPDGDPLTITGFTQGQYGTVTQEGSQLRYSHNGSNSSSDSFTYTITDGRGGTDTATVRITIQKRPDLVVTKIKFENNKDDDDDDCDNDGRRDDDDDDDDNDGRKDHDDDDDDNDHRRDGHSRHGDKVTITATVTNIGGATAGSSKTEFLLDGTRVLALVDTGSIAPGSSRKVTIFWNTRSETPGPHQIKVTADRNGQVTEVREDNNTRTETYTVQQNHAHNGSYEDDNDHDNHPDHWSSSSGSAGSTSWSQAGSDGARSASIAGNGGNAALHGSPTWTSTPIAVTPGTLMDLQLSALVSGASSPASAGLVYLGPLGNVVDRATLITTPLSTAGFAPLEQAVTIPAGVVSVQIVLTGFSSTDLATAGTVTFDDVGLFVR